MKKNVILLFLCACLALSLSACGQGTSDQEETDAWQTQGRDEQGQEEQDQNVQSSGDVTQSGSDGDSGNLSEAAVIYSWDNSKTDAQPKSGTFTGDWDKDGTEDSLNIETEEQEGSEIIKKLELNVSGCAAPYVLEDLNYYFIDIIPGDFDADSEPEILLLFDMRYAGANGCLGLRLLDLTDTGYVDLTEDFFTGFEYSVEVKAGENGSYTVSRTDGEPMEIRAGNVSESSIGMVTGFYSLDVLRDSEDVCFLEIKQYVAGEYMTDHVGDVVSIWEVRDGALQNLSEETTDLSEETTDLSMESLPVSIAEDMLSFVSACGSGKCGDGYLELLCPEGLLAAPSPGGSLYFFRDGVYCGCLFPAEFDEPYDESWKDNAERCGVGELCNMQASWDFLYEAETPQQYVYAGKRAVYSFGDTEFLQEKEILTADEALEEEAAIYAALIGKSGAKYGYYLEVSQRLVDEEMLELLLRNMTVREGAFTSAGDGEFATASVQTPAQESMSEPMWERAQLPENDIRFWEASERDCGLTYEMAFGDLRARVPEGMRGLRSGEAQWLIYDNYDNRSETGYARGESIEGFAGVEEAILEYASVSDMDDEQITEKIVREEDGTYTFRCSYEVQVSGEGQANTLSQTRTREIWIDSQGKNLLLVDLCEYL